MKERVTLVTLFNEKVTKKINNLINIVDEPLCKVPYLASVEDRVFADTLPFHFTIIAWSKDKEKEVISILKSINFKKIKVYVDKVNVKKTSNNSYLIYLSIKENEEIKSLQRTLYEKMPVEKYNPDKFTFHISLQDEKDYEKAVSFQQKMNTVFEPFEVEISELGLFEIYPAELVYKVSSTD